MVDAGLLQRSLYGGVLILVICAVRALLLGRMPKRIFPILWCVVLLRLLLPISFSSAFSVYSFLRFGRGQEIPEETVYGGTGGLTATDGPFDWTAAQNLIPAAGLPDSAAESLVLAEKGAFSVPFMVWAAGAVSCFAFFGLAYLNCLRRFRRAVPVEDGRIRRWLGRHGLRHWIAVRQSDRISAPLTYGVVRPVILLPESLVWDSDRELEYVLQHEYVHIRHYDGAVKLAMIAALCVHWFNPLVWLMSGLLSRDIELACDEGVLHRFGEQSRAGYAMTLIGMEEKKRGLLPLYNGFSKNAIEERIRLIMKYKKITYMTCVTALLLVLTIVLVFATSAKPAEATGNPGIPSGNAPGEDMTDIPLDPPGGSVDPGAIAPEAGSRSNDSELLPENPDNIGSGEAANDEYVISYMQEGLPQEEPADLYVGEGYCILIPKEGWQLYAPDAWAWEKNEQIQFWVNDCGGSTREQVEARLQEDGYRRTDADGVMEKESDGRLMFAEVKEEGFTVMCLNYAYPADSEHVEGFLTLMRAIAANFTVMPVGDDEGLSEDGKQIKQTAMAFWEAYLGGNSDAVRGYLAENYDYDTWGVDVFPDGADGHVAREAQVQAVKGLDVGACSVGDELEIWVEFRPAAGADYLETLTMTVRKQQDGWKVLSYGLEM